MRLDRTRLEQICVIAPLGQHLIASIGDVEIKIEMLVMARVGDKFGLRLSERHRRQINTFVKVEHHRSKHHAAWIALDAQSADQFAIGVGLMIESIEHGAAHSGKMAAKARSPIYAAADRQQIDAMANNTGHAACCLARHRQADDDIRAVADPGNIKLVGCQKQGNESHPLLTCKLAQPRRQIG